MNIITLQRLVNAVFGGSYPALHEWQAEVVGRHGIDFNQMYREMLNSFSRLWTLKIRASGNRDVDYGLLAVLSLMQMANNEVILPGRTRLIVAFLEAEPSRSATSDAVIAFLRPEVAD